MHIPGIFTYLMKVYAFILDSKSGIFLMGKERHYIHHLVWCTVQSAQSPYGCGVLFICPKVYQSPESDKRICSTLFLCHILVNHNNETTKYIMKNHILVSFTNFCTINSIGKDDPRRPERAVLVEVDFQSIHGKTDKSRAH